MPRTSAASWPERSREELRVRWFWSWSREKRVDVARVVRLSREVASLDDIRELL